MRNILSIAEMSTAELLANFSRILQELRRRGISRSSNNPVADYSEWLAARVLSLELVTKSTAGYDAVDRAGNRYEIKGRRFTRQNRPTQLSAIRGLPEHHFDFLVVLLVAEDFTIMRASVIPFDVVKSHAVNRKHVNAWILYLRDDLWHEPGVRDVTEEARKKVPDTIREVTP
jgi:hypothetical protein